MYSHLRFPYSGNQRIRAIPAGHFSSTVRGNSSERAFRVAILHQFRRRFSLEDLQTSGILRYRVRYLSCSLPIRFVTYLPTSRLRVLSIRLISHIAPSYYSLQFARRFRYHQNNTSFYFELSIKDRN